MSLPDELASLWEDHDPMDRLRSIDGVLQARARLHGDRWAFAYWPGRDEAVQHISYAALDRRARQTAAALHQRVDTTGSRGARIVLFHAPGLGFISTFFGCLYAGMVPVPLYPPSGRSRQKTHPWLAPLRTADPPLICCDDQTQKAVATALTAAAVDVPCLNVDRDLDPHADITPATHAGEDLAFLQFTSGSTGQPKGVMIQHGNLMANQVMIGEAFATQPADIGVNWLPLYHDMGLIGTVLHALYAGIPSLLMPPVQFIRQPASWLSMITKVHGTICGGPDFAFATCAQKINPSQAPALDLRRWRVAFNGAEPIRAESLQQFAATFARVGFDATAFLPCYGMAETTLIVTGCEAKQPPPILPLDATALTHHRAQASEDETNAQMVASCGLPLTTGDVLIVNPDTCKPLTDDLVGEIWVTGPHVAAGYWQQPDLTKKTFAAHTQSGAGPYLRTGDLGFIHQGQLYVTGRRKDLIIVHGRNHYPQDIEHTIANSDAAFRTGSGAVFTVQAAGQTHLVACQEVTRQAVRKLNAPALLATAREAVAHMHGLALDDLVLLKPSALPRTTSGKVRRNPCKQRYVHGDFQRLGPAPDITVKSPVAGNPVAGTTATDATKLDIDHLAQAVAKLLQRQPQAIDPQQPLTALGVDSLKAAEIAEQLAAQFDLDVDLADVLAGASLADLADMASVPAAPIPTKRPPRPADGEPFPTAPNQAALWFLHQLAPEAGAYHLSFAFDLVGDEARPTASHLRSIAARLHRRHDALHTRFIAADDGPLQVRDPQLPVPFETLACDDWDEAKRNRYLAREASRPFDPSRQPPWRMTCLTHKDRAVTLLLTVHHMAIDFASLRVLFEEWRQLLAEPTASLPAPYQHYHAFAATSRAQADNQADLDYWRQLLTPLPEPFVGPERAARPAVQTYRGQTHHFHWDAATAVAVHKLATQHHTTPFAVLLAGFYACLFRLSQQRDLTIGTPIAGNPSDNPAAVGYFVNPLVTRAHDRHASFTDLLARLSDQLQVSLKHRHFPFHHLVETLHPKRDPSRTPLFQVFFTLLQGAPSLAPFLTGEAASIDAGPLQLRSRPLTWRPAPFDLSLQVMDTGQGFAGLLESNRNLFSATTGRAILSSLTHLLTAAILSPERPLHQLPLLSPATLQAQLRALQAVPATEPGPTLTQSILARAARHPDHIACASGPAMLSYDCLVQTAVSVAQSLRKVGVGNGDRVAILVQRNERLPASLLGVWLCGAAYVPLDAGLPNGRLQAMLQDAAPVAILIDQPQDQLADLPIRQVNVPAQPFHSAPATVTDCSDAHLPAYLIFTSGSTGTPKAVTIFHHNVSLFAAGIDQLNLPKGAGVWLATTRLTFDISVLELLWTLSRGYTLVVQPIDDGAMFPSHQDALQRLSFSLFYFADEAGTGPDQYQLLLAGARFADQEGFEAVWTPERHFHPFGGLYPNPSVTSAALAAITERVHLRAGSVVLPLHDAVRVAEEWSFVDNLSGGRIGLSVAAGWNADDFVFAPDSFAENKAVMQEKLADIRQLWRGEPLIRKGGRGQDVAVNIYPPPFSDDLPIWFTAAGNPETFRQAGTAGANILTHLLGQSVTELAEKIAIYRAARQAADQPGPGRITLMLHTFIGEDVDQVRETVRVPFSRYLASSLGLMKGLAAEMGLDITAPDFDEQARDQLIARAFDRFFDSSALFGTPTSVAPLLGELAAIGVDEIGCLVDFGVPYTDAVRGLERLNQVKRRCAAPPPADHSIATHCARYGVTHLQTTPSGLNLVLDHDATRARLQQLQVVLVGGEAVTAKDVAELPHQALVRNMYGPTETTIWSSSSIIADDTQAPPTGSLGTPLQGQFMLCADDHLYLRPQGIPGELLIGGNAVTGGYHDQPALTASRFLPDPFSGRSGARLYRTGDRVVHADSVWQFLGRMDFQVKLRGYRIEPGEIETILLTEPGIHRAVVQVRQQRLVAYVDGTFDADQLQDKLSNHLPAYMVPQALVPVTNWPLNAAGKLDRKALPDPMVHATGPAPASGLERQIAAVWQDILELPAVSRDQSFFELGGHSLLLTKAHRRLQADLDPSLTMVDLFRHATIQSLADFIGNKQANQPPSSRAAAQESPRAAKPSEATQPQRATAAQTAPADPHQPIAIVAMACRFPGANDPETFWSNLLAGVESITPFDDEALLAAGVHPALVADPHYVKAGAVLDNVGDFDASFFGYAPAEAALLDPQHRLFLECAWETFERAGMVPGQITGKVGVFAGSGMNTYLLNNLTRNRGALGSDAFQIMIANDKDFLPTRTAHRMDLRGPAVSVQTGCSTSLVAVDTACRQLRAGLCDVALAGAASVRVPQVEGYRYEPGMIASPDGHCRPFDAAGAGTLFGSGVGVVLLKPLHTAIADKDPILAVIKGSAVNNDGADKVSFTAPSVSGQVAVLQTALADAQVTSDGIQYIEAHGTATELGDPIEWEALQTAYPHAKDCAVGAVKSNVGHLDTAAGMAGLIKTVMAMQSGRLAPTLHYQTANPKLKPGGFRVVAQAEDWPSSGNQPRRAGVSAFGIGGTNAHIILEAAPAPHPTQTEPNHNAPQLLLLSAKTHAALAEQTARLAQWWSDHPQASVADVAWTLQTGRRAFAVRRCFVAQDAAEAQAVLAEPEAQGAFTTEAHQTKRPLVFLFPGGGAQYVGMGRALYESYDVFREAFEQCNAVVKPIHGDLTKTLFAADANGAIPDAGLGLAALFSVSYAQARLLMAWGIQPTATMGHSMGEYVAACIAGVFTPEDAVALVMERGRLFETLPRGGMVSIPLPANRIEPLLNDDLVLAARNGPTDNVVSGPADAVATFTETLDHHGLEYRRIQIDVAAHHPMLDTIVPAFTRFVADRRLQPPKLPVVSNVTGTWLTREQATDPAYWGRHLRETVQFGEGLALLVENPDHLFVEVGPGRSLSTLGKAAVTAERRMDFVPTMRHPRDREVDRVFLLQALGRLWARGAHLHWRLLHHDQPPQRLVLPTYAFQRERHWIEPRDNATPTAQHSGKNPRVDDWFYTPTWSSQPPRLTGGDLPTNTHWIIFDDGSHGRALADQLTAQVISHHLVPREDAHANTAAFYTDLWADVPDEQALCLIYAWPLAPSPTAPQHRGYDSLLALAQALAKLNRPVHLWVLANQLSDPSGGAQIDPTQSLLLGPAMVMGQELDHVHCRIIDVSRPATPMTTAALLGELNDRNEHRLVALRPGTRWLRDYTHLPVGDSAPRLRTIPSNAVVLIAGGSGTVGTTIAKALAVPGRQLALLARKPPTAWSESARAAITACEAAGAAVATFQADLTDPPSLTAAINAVHNRFGPVQVAVHAAGVAGAETVQLLDTITPADSARHFAAKVNGTDNLVHALQHDPLVVGLLISSNVTVLGGLGATAYTAANAYLDALAAQQQAQGQPWLAADWDGWPTDDAAPRFQTSIDQYAMTEREATTALLRVLTASPVAQTVVSSGDLHARLAMWQQKQAVQAQKPRPALTTSAVSPRNPLEDQIAAAWRAELGLAELGIYDNFFDLGGNSLVALKLVKRLKADLGRDVPVVSLFEGPTVAALATLLDKPQGNENALKDSESRGSRRRGERRKKQRVQLGSDP